MRKTKETKVPVPRGWFIEAYKGHNTFHVCKFKNKKTKTYCLKVGSPAFTKASAHGLAPKIRKSIGIFVLYDYRTDDKNYVTVTSDIPANASLMPLVLKEISRLHKLGLSYEGRIYVDKKRKLVNFTRFKERDQMSPLEWIFELIKDYETLAIMHKTEYSKDPNLKWFMRKIDKSIHNIAKIL
jgi:hypothetical protein